MRPGDRHVETVGPALPGIEVRILPPDTADDRTERRRGRRSAARSSCPATTTGPTRPRPSCRTAGCYTGDLGRLDEDGRLTITGRKKEIIVLSSGKNIYPEEIEAHYRQSPFIKELCVLGLDAARRAERRAPATPWSCPTPTCCARRRSSTPAICCASRSKDARSGCRRTSACSATTSGWNRCRARRPAS